MKLSKPDGLPRGPICGLVALAVLSNEDYEYIRRIYARRFIKNEGAWKGRTHLSNLVDILYDELQLNITREWYDVQDGKKLRVPFHSWVEDLAEKDKAYLVHVRNHFFVYCNGLCIDQAAELPVWRFPYRNRRVKVVYEIELPSYHPAFKLQA